MLRDRHDFFGHVLAYAVGLLGCSSAVYAKSETARGDFVFATDNELRRLSSGRWEITEEIDRVTRRAIGSCQIRQGPVRIMLTGSEPSIELRYKFSADGDMTNNIAVREIAIDNQAYKFRTFFRRYSAENQPIDINFGDPHRIEEMFSRDGVEWLPLADILDLMAAGRSMTIIGQKERSLARISLRGFRQALDHCRVLSESE